MCSLYRSRGKTDSRNPAEVSVGCQTHAYLACSGRDQTLAQITQMLNEKETAAIFANLTSHSV